MSDVPPQFRIEADRVRPGCVFCTELVPDNAQALELLTGSWQQTAPRPYQTPLLRYVFPEHRSHYISRWSIDAERDDMLKKAVMNGSGLVIWPARVVAPTSVKRGRLMRMLWALGPLPIMISSA